MSNSIKISAVIITYNEEKNIGRCIDSLKSVADELVVVDSFSTDSTKKICLEKGARVIDHEFESHINQKNFALHQATANGSDWAIILDSHERLSVSGFLMTLSGFVPDLIEKDFAPLMKRALQKTNITEQSITHWCIHPGGKRILDSIQKSLSFNNGELSECYQVLKDFGNMSSPTILFVLKKIMDSLTFPVSPVKDNAAGHIFGAAFGPGLTMETFLASPHA